MPKALKFLGIGIIVIVVMMVALILIFARQTEKLLVHPDAARISELEALIPVVFVDVAGFSKKDIHDYELGEWAYTLIPDYHAKALIHLKVGELYLHEFVKKNPCIREGWCWSPLSNYEHPMDQKYTIKIQGTITKDRGFIPYQQKLGSILSITEIGIIPFRSAVYFSTEGG
jgi:hypothetical protein